MSEQNNKPASTWSNPQVIGAIIGGIVTIIVAFIGILPLLIDNDDDPTTPIPPVPSPTEIVVEASPIPFDIVTEETPVIATETETAIEVPTSDVLLFPNLELLFDDVAFTLRNISTESLNLDDLVFISASGQWQATQWGTTLSVSVPENNCLRLRDTASAQRQPPASCGNLLGLQLVSGSALFWLNASTFDVVYNDNVIGTCTTSSSPCLVAIP